MQVTEENGTLDFSSVGGLNHPQFSNMDFDADGMNDFLVFDKTGDKLPDLVIGEKTGGLNDYHKDGASTSPNSAFADANFGSVNMTALGSAGGYNAPFLLENVEMTGYNMLGEKVWNGNSRNSIRESIDLTLLESGIYRIDLRSKNKIAAKRFVIQS